MENIASGLDLCFVWVLCGCCLFLLFGRGGGGGGVARGWGWEVMFVICFFFLEGGVMFGWLVGWFVGCLVGFDCFCFLGT